MLRVTMLGCGGSAGVPQLGGPDGRGDWGACNPADPRNRRTRSSIVIESQGKRLLVDASPDMRAQLLACAIPSIDAILFTHAHADHVLGIDDIRILNRIANRPIDAYATETTMAELDRRFDYAFKPWQPPNFFRPALIPHIVDYNTTIQPAGFPIHLFEQDHGFISTAGLRIENFAYSTDVAKLEEPALQTLEGIDTWIVDCFQRRAHTTHANLDQVITWSTRLKPRRVILTHMGHDIDHTWIQQNAPQNFEPGQDGLILNLP